jgi:hypothetical protein
MDFMIELSAWIFGALIRLWLTKLSYRAHFKTSDQAAVSTVNTNGPPFGTIVRIMRWVPDRVVYKQALVTNAP